MNFAFPSNFYLCTPYTNYAFEGETNTWLGMTEENIWNPLEKHNSLKQRINGIAIKKQF